MRFENWDVIIFPRDSHVPIQEFKTTCYVAHDEFGRQIHTLSCYITSLSPLTPFRISVHSWSTQPKPSPLIESQRRSNERVVYTTQVVIDGTNVSQVSHELTSRWPLDIGKHGSVHSSESSQGKALLLFPGFSTNLLMRTTWDPREDNGQIKLLLSEDLISANADASATESRASNNIVCFSFRHAPRDILEQAGIAWPLRNPLHLPCANPMDPALASITVNQTKAQLPMGRTQVVSSSKIPSRFMNPKRRAEQPIRSQPHNKAFNECMDLFPDISYFSHPLGGGFDPTVGAWDTSTTSSLDGPLNSMRMCNGFSAANDEDGSRAKIQSRNSEKASQHDVVTFNEDQFGHLVDHSSPRKQKHGSAAAPSRTALTHHQDSPPPGQGKLPKLGTSGPPMIGMRPRPPVSAGSASFLDLQSPFLGVASRPMSALSEDGHKLSAKSVQPSASTVVNGKENRNPSENRILSPFTFDYPFDSRFPTPHSALQGPAWGSFGKGMSSWDRDTEMRDQATTLSDVTRPGKESSHNLSKHGPAPNPGSNGIKSRKEGLGIDLPASTVPLVRHDQSLLPSLNTEAVDEVTRGSSNACPLTNIAEVEKSGPFAPSHRSGMSSIEKIETKLYSALGEAMGDELNMFPLEGQMIDTRGPGSSTDTGSPTMKRKRQGSIGRERGRSPEAKTIRENITTSTAPMPRLRGGD